MEEHFDLPNRLLVTKNEYERIVYEHSTILFV
jgi:hypothetical protein